MQVGKTEALKVIQPVFFGWWNAEGRDSIQWHVLNDCKKFHSLKLSLVQEYHSLGSISN